MPERRGLFFLAVFTFRASSDLGLGATTVLNRCHAQALFLNEISVTPRSTKPLPPRNSRPFPLGALRENPLWAKLVFPSLPAFPHESSPKRIRKKRPLRQVLRDVKKNLNGRALFPDPGIPKSSLFVCTFLPRALVSLSLSLSFPILHHLASSYTGFYCRQALLYAGKV